VYVTIAGIDDIPIADDSDLFRNLHAALRRYGDPQVHVQLAVRELLLLILRARVRIAPEYQWETREPKIRSALLGHFGFDRRDLGQDALLSEALSVIQAVPGVVYTDVEVFDRVAQSVNVYELEDLANTLAREERIVAALAGVRPAQPATVFTGPTPGRVTPPSQGPLTRPVNAAELEPAQLAIFSPSLTDNLILTELT
jgi:hypothetical protein